MKSLQTASTIVFLMLALPTLWFFSGGDGDIHHIEKPAIDSTELKINLEKKAIDKSASIHSYFKDSESYGDLAPVENLG